MADVYPPDLSIDDIKVKIQQTSSNPNIGETHQVILKKGPRTFRIATIFEIINPTTKKLHHLSLQLNSFDKTKKVWRAKPDKNVRLDGKDPNEIKILSDFLSAALSEQYPDSAGEVRVIPSNQYKLIENLVELLPKLPGSRKLELTKPVLQSLEEIVGVTV